MERWTLAAHDDDRIMPHSVEERCSQPRATLFAHLIDDEYKHLNTLREHGGFHKALLEGRTLKHFHVYIKEDDASQWSVLPHVDNGAFLLLTKTLDVPGNGAVPFRPGRVALHGSCRAGMSLPKRLN